MKQLKKLLILLLVFTLVLTVSACRGNHNQGDSDRGINEEVDKEKVQLYVGNFNRGFGAEWLYAAKKRFEEFYKDVNFEKKKKGVQVLIDNIDDFGVTYLNFMKNSRNAVVFNESCHYYDYVNAGLVSDITDIVKKDLSVYGDTGTIEDKLFDQYKIFYTAKDGKYYGIPHYSAYEGIVYDVDFFDENKFYFAADKNNGNNGFIIRPDDKRSLGPNGKTGTTDGTDYSYDDGLPATYDEFFALCERIKLSGNLPITWTGTHRGVYLSYILNALAIDYEGRDQTLLNFNFDGTAKNLVAYIDDDGNVVKDDPLKITNANGYEMYRTAGRYYAIDFLKRLIYKEPGVETGYWRNGFTGGMSQTETQDLFITSKDENERIAMLIDGIWWENEANPTFNNLATGDPSLSKYNRKFGFLPLPRPTEEQVGAKRTLYDSLYSIAFVNKNAESDPVIFDLAKKFLMFVNTRQSLEEFNVITNTPKNLRYELSDENYNKMSYFGKSVWNLRKNSDLVFPISTNPLYLNNANAFSYGSSFDFEIDGKIKTLLGDALYYDKLSSKDIFDGIRNLHSKSAWEGLYSEYIR